MIYINGKALRKAVQKRATHPASFVLLGVAACTALYTQLMLIVLGVVLGVVQLFSHGADMAVIVTDLSEYVTRKNRMDETNKYINWLQLRLVVLPLQLALINHLINLTTEPEALGNLFKVACIYTILWSSVLAARLSHLNKLLKPGKASNYNHDHF